MNCITFPIFKKAYREEVVGAVDMHRLDLEEKGSYTEVPHHFDLRDGYRREGAGRRTLAEHSPLVLEEETAVLGEGTNLSQVQDKKAPALE